MVNVSAITRNVVALLVVLAVMILLIVVFLFPSISGVLKWIAGVLIGWPG